MTKFGKLVYFFNIKDTAGKTAFVYPSLTQDIRAFCESIRRAYDFFLENFHYRIQLIQTDHCGVCKTSELRKSNEFIQLLNKLGIQHRYAYYKQPKYNGTVERDQQIIEKELRVALKNCSNMLEIMSVCMKFNIRRNFKRFHSYCHREKSKVIIERNIPIAKVIELLQLPINQSIRV
jgi:hypothetical protein